MAKGGGAIAGAFIGSIILSVAITSAAGYFLLPMVYPGMRGQETITPIFIYEEFDSIAQKLDDDTSWTVVPDTFFDVEIKNNNSRILCTFSASCLIGASSSLGTSTLSWEIYLDIFGPVVGKSEYVKILDHAGISYAREISTAFSMEMCTVPLEAGNYTVQVMWRSLGDVGGSNYLLFNTPS